MGIMTDNLQQINKSIQNQTASKILKKDCKENFEIYLFPIIWNKYATDKNPEKTYIFFKNPKTVAQYIQLTEIKKDDGAIKKTIYFNELTLTDKTKIYHNILELINKQYKNILPLEQVETYPIIENISKILVTIIYLTIGFFISIFTYKPKLK